MKLDRYTQKAQEAILTAQQLASGAKSPVLDVASKPLNGVYVVIASSS